MSQIKKEAEKLSGWTVEDETLTRSFSFGNFLEGIDFVQNLAAYSEGAQHHPFITIDHTTITVKWTTVDQGKLTQKDLDAAKACNQFYSNE
ncbi:4a-hydroxytetrahydrobiopterin dehydratase [Shouchella sp. JSM 1781072]|uniref:4a-hydroxytetrahydrobiopterin dehydratase n=1 Tax=Bacillaceae TaxID=186817 RepID=UPI000C06F001|nr:MULTISPECIES: 4a-hydroxytetrahydrobiopterin dehydratase [Bacillaceae]UTR06384.1 4a-hydroxytetrahydrobiopterin dehydratase [Alkalihalobacillus sp. LMS6]